jgi:hypothetical protein
MPSSKNPNDIAIGAGKIPTNTVSASAQISPSVGGSGVDPSLNVYRPIVSGVINDTTYPQYVGTGASTLDVTTGVLWLGDSVIDLPEELVALVSPSGVTDSFLDLEPILEASGAPLKVTGLSRVADAANLIGTGFVDASVTPLRVSFSGALAVGLVYRLVYSKPSTLRDTSDLQKNNPLRALSQLGYATQLSTRNAVSSGLNDRYRRSTATIDTDSVDLDTPGSGAEITRDGQALSVVSPVFDSAQAYPAGPYPDKFLSSYIAKFDTSQTPVTVYNEDYSGNIGFLNIYPSRSYGSGTTDTAEPIPRGGFFAGTVSAFPVNVLADTNAKGDVITRIAAKSPATLVNARVILDAPNYVARDLGAGYRSAISPNVDMLEVEFPNGDIRTFMILNVDAANNRLDLTALGGGALMYDSTAVLVTWYQVTAKLGGPSTAYLSKPRAANEGFLAFESVLDLVTPDEVIATNTPVFRIGQFQPSLPGVGYNLSVYGSGAGTGRYGTWEHVYKPRIDRADFVNTTSSVLIDPTGSDITTTHGSHHFYNVTQSSGTHTMSVFSDLSAETEGVTVDIFVYNINGVNMVMIWDDGFVFSEESDAQFGAANSTGFTTVHWRATCVYLDNLSEYKYLISRAGDYTVDPPVG